MKSSRTQHLSIFTFFAKVKVKRRNRERKKRERAPSRGKKKRTERVHEGSNFGVLRHGFIWETTVGDLSAETRGGVRRGRRRRRRRERRGEERRLNPPLPPLFLLVTSPPLALPSSSVPRAQKRKNHKLLCSKDSRPAP